MQTNESSECQNQPDAAQVDGIVHTRWHAYFSVHGDPSVVTDPARPVFTEVCKVSKSPADYGRENALLIAEAPEMLELLRRLVHGELPEADDDCTPDNVTLTVSHMDHEDYRRCIRQAEELIARVV